MEIRKLNPVESLTLENGNKEDWTACIILFCDVKNGVEIYQKLLKGEIQAALMNPNLIIDVFQLTVAVNKAVRSHLTKKMATKTLYTEIIYNLSPVRKISQALQNFGIRDKSTNILAVTVSPNAKNDYHASLSNLIDGHISPLNNLSTFTDIQLIKKIYKLTDEEVKNGSILGSVLGRMACKDFT